MRESAFQAQQEAFSKMKDLGRIRSAIKDELDASWSEVSAARDRMNESYQENQHEWERFKSRLDELSDEIDEANRQGDYYHRLSQEAFDRASNEYEYGDRAMAPIYSSEARGYQSERDDWNATKSRLIDRRRSLERPSNSFEQDKAHYERMKSQHSHVQARYQTAKAAHESAKAEFEDAKTRHESARSDFERHREHLAAKWRDVSCADCGAAFRINVDWTHPPKYCKACKEKFRQKKIDLARKAGKYVDPEDVKVRFNYNTGKNDVYFGGLGEADGYGHGHAVVDERGNVHYLRDATFGDKEDAVIIDDGVKL